MTGPIQSYPEKNKSLMNGLREDYSASCHWFGSLPPNLDQLKGYNTKLFPEMAKFFGFEKSETYRVFIRKVPRAVVGSGFFGSYVLDYDDHVGDEQPEYAIVHLFTYEMVHSFVSVDVEENEGYDNA